MMSIFVATISPSCNNRYRARLSVGRRLKPRAAIPDTLEPCSDRLRPLLLNEPSAA